MKRNLLFIIALFLCALSYSQGELDAYRYSSNDLSGTARGQAMAGAFGALGGDMTGVAINPAGLGVYRSSELVANISLASPLTGGNTHRESSTKFSVDNLSYIKYYPYISGGMLSLNFAFNYNRTKDFKRIYSTSKASMSTSMTDFMADNLNLLGISHNEIENNPYKSNEWLGELGWRGFLLNPAADDKYVSVLKENDKVSPSLRVSEKGMIESYDFSIGSSIQDRFFWGATISITDLSYVMTSVYDEKFLGEQKGGFGLTNYLETQGSGFQLKTGIIVKPVDALRIGLAYHSPVWYTMTDYFHATVYPRETYTDFEETVLAKPSSTPDDAYASYYLRTPGAVTLSLAGVLGAKAVVSMDYELKNYASMSMKDKDNYSFEDNKLIKSHFKNTSTLRVGMEYRFTPQFSGRLGYAWAQSPYKKSLSETGENIKTVGTIADYMLSNCTSYYTGGIGYRFTPQLYLDFAMVFRTQNDDIYLFNPKEINGAKADSFQGTYVNKSLKGLLTLGYKF